VLTGVTGVFLARDLLLFYFFWELMLVPMYFLIGIWGHERRVYAAVKFFLFTFISSLLMLGAILALVFAHFRATSVLTFDSAALLRHSLPNDDLSHLHLWTPRLPEPRPREPAIRQRAPAAQ
jgi:NADH-quinone oxidoreductase subunit M